MMALRCAGKRTRLWVLAGLGIAVIASAWGVHKHLLGAEFKERGVERSSLGFYRAIKKGDVAAIKLFFADGFSPNTRYGQADEPILFMAIDTGQLTVVRTFIDSGADVNATSRGGHQSIHAAATRAQADIVEELIKAGADPNAYGYPETEGGAFVPLVHATLVASRDLSPAEAQARYDTVKLLLEHDAQVNVYYPGVMGGDGPLHHAASTKGLEQTVKLLLEHGAELEHEGYGGDTPLMNAAIMGNGKTVEVLLAAGAQPNHRTKRGTALILATQRGHIEVVRMLLNAGADPRLADATGKNAYDFARHSEITRLLKTARSGRDK